MSGNVPYWLFLKLSEDNEYMETNVEIAVIRLTSMWVGDIDARFKHFNNSQKRFANLKEMWFGLKGMFFLNEQSLFEVFCDVVDDMKAKDLHDQVTDGLMDDDHMILAIEELTQEALSQYNMAPTECQEGQVSIITDCMYFSTRVWEQGDMICGISERDWEWIKDHVGL